MFPPPHLSSTTATLSAQVISRGWPCPANSVPPQLLLHPPFPGQLMTYLSPPATVATAAPTAEEKAPFTCWEQHPDASSSNWFTSSLLELLFRLIHPFLECSHLSSAPTAKTKFLLAPAERGQAPPFPNFLTTHYICSVLLDFGPLTSLNYLLSSYNLEEIPFANLFYNNFFSLTHPCCPLFQFIKSSVSSLTDSPKMRQGRSAISPTLMDYLMAE